MTRVDRWWDEYARIYASLWKPFDSTWLDLAERVGIESPARVLDLGSGAGAVGNVARVRGCVVVSVDKSTRMLHGQREDRLRIQAQAQALPFEDDSFSMVVIANLLHLVEDAVVVLGEAWRVTEPGGRLIVTVPSDAVTPLSLARYELMTLRLSPASVLVGLIQRLSIAVVARAIGMGRRSAAEVHELIRQSGWASESVKSPYEALQSVSVVRVDKLTLM